MSATESTAIDIGYVDETAWEQWRDIRLRALRDSPDAFGSTLAKEAAFTGADWQQRLGGPGVCVLARCDGVPVGMGAGWPYEDGKVMIVAMWTDPGLRGRGIGSGVLDLLVTWAREHRRRPDLWVADANPAARALYERYGFRANGETAPLREGSPLTMSRLVLPEN